MADDSPPPPPENPFGMNGDGDAYTDIPADGGLGQSAPNVAAKPGRVMLVLGVVGLVLIVLLYLIFFSSKDKGDGKPKDRPVVTAPKDPPPLPKDTTDIVAPKNIMPPPIPQPTDIKLLKPKDDSAEKAEALARMRSKMLVTDPDRGGGMGSLLGSKSAPSKDPNAAFAATITAADRVEATRIGNLSRTIAQGRLIQATTESAINTDLPAPIRAIVSRDTYGESGTVPLIPKGSRLIGEYNTDITGGQNRVFVVWKRVIRPDGIDVELSNSSATSPLVDQIGIAGIGGQVDTKFQAIFSRAVMSSIVSIGFAMGEDKISGGSTTTTSNASGTSTTGDAASTATINALNRMGAVTDGFLQKFADLRPTILVDQGTKVNVFVNRDVVFPSDIAGTRILN